MVKDKVLTISIGRNYGIDNTPLSWADWEEFCFMVNNIVDYDATIVFEGYGGGVGSDDNRLGAKEDSYAIIAVNCQNTRRLRRSLATLLRRYRQSSACFSIDHAHNPVFNTVTGNRA